MLTFHFHGADGKMFGSEVLTAGMAGRKIRLEFSGEWDGMAKTAVFTAGGVTRDVLVDSDTVTIPAEVLQKPLEQLFVGVYGASADGRVMPTVQVAGPYICEGTDPAGDESVDPTLPVWGILDVDLTGLNLHYEGGGTWIYPLKGILDAGSLLEGLRSGRQLRLHFRRKGSPLTVMLNNCRLGENNGVCSGMFAEALSDSDALRGIITLEIMREDTAMLVTCMNPPQGITPDQAEQIRANTQAIADLPVSVSEDGCTEITGGRHPVSVRMAREGDTVTVTTTLQGGVVHTDRITLDQRGYPVSVMANGVECVLEFMGFEEGAEDEI